MSFAAADKAAAGEQEADGARGSAAEPSVPETPQASDTGSTLPNMAAA